MKKIICLIFSIALCAARADSATNLSQARYAEDFALLDNSGKFQQLYYYSDMKAVVLVSQENGCPIIQKSYLTLEGLKKKYAPLGVVFLMINANPQDDRDSINQEARSYGVDIPILEDRAQIVTEGLGIKRTAEALVINPKDWSIAYQGPINDQFGYETQKIAPTKNYLQDAIEAVLANKPVLVHQVSIKGCLFDFDIKNKPLSYTKDIAPILINKCIVCHSPGQIGPWSMDNYEKVKSHGAMIREVVRTKRMPPWGLADPFYQKLENDKSLSPEQIHLLVHWIEQGMSRGDGSDPLLTAVRPAALNKWPLKKPDLIISFKNKQSIPATGFLNIRTVLGDKIMDQDRWVGAIYWKPGNSKALHHAYLLVEDFPVQHQEWFYNSGFNLDEILVDKNSHAISVLGRQGRLPKDTGMFLPKGTRFLFSLHYAATGKPETDYTQVGLYFYQKKPGKILSAFSYSNRILNIPARAKDFKVTGFVPIKERITLYSICPHMHLRGRAMKFIAHYPDGSSQIILSVPNYRFNSQNIYSFKNPISIPAGTILEIQAVYDNSTQNPDNPAPNKTVHWGIFIQDEMMSAMMFCVKEHSSKLPDPKN